MLEAMAHNMLLAKYKATAVSTIILRPQMSLSFTHTGAAAPLAKTYAPPIQEYPEAEPRLDTIVGSAVAVIVLFKAAMKSVLYGIV